MSAEELMSRFAMTEHPENGQFVERHYIHEGEGRPASGSMYYYVAPGELTEFHRIDCDEYWCYAEGAPLDIWVLDEEKQITVLHLGTEEGCEPLAYLKQGWIFGSKHPVKGQDGTFLTCITVPRFHYEGFEMFTKEQMLEMAPELSAFFEQ